MAIIQQVFTCVTMVSGNSLTSSLELPGNYLYVYLEVPTMSAGYSADKTPLWLQVSSDNVTFRRFSNPETNTNTVGVNDFAIVSACTNRMVYVPEFAFRFVKIEISGTATGATASPPPFKFICVSEQ